jgi:hypothetical protein
VPDITFHIIREVDVVLADFRIENIQRDGHTAQRLALPAAEERKD